MTAAPSADASGLPLHEQIFQRSALLAQVAARVARGGVVPVARAGDSAAALLLASLGRGGHGVLAVAPTPDAADRLRRDWQTFLGEEVLEFPPWESLFEDDSEPDPETFRQRHEVLEGFAGGQPRAVVAPVHALLQPVARTEQRSDRRIIVREGDPFPPDQLARALVDAGYRRFPQVARPGDFSIRGGIFDIFPRESGHPYRIDYFGDEVDSICTVDLATQRSGESVSLLALGLAVRSDYFLRGFTGSEVTLFDRMPRDVLLAILSPRQTTERAEELLDQWVGRGVPAVASEFWGRAARHTRVELEPIAVEPGRDPITLPVAGADAFTGSLDRVLATLRDESASGTTVRIHFRQPAEAERFEEILADSGLVSGGDIATAPGELTSSFRWQEPDGGIFLSGTAILGRTRSLDRRTRKAVPTRAIDSFLDLEEGEYVVHVSHGIGRYEGVRLLHDGRRHGEHLVITYRDGVQLLVPAERIDLVQRYVAVGKAAPKLDRYNGTQWASRRARVEEGVLDLASEMIEVQALRAEREGIAFPADTPWQEEFAAAFPFEETADQLRAIEAVQQDLESARPMDRLVCGDVGFGKTEIAMRAAFKVTQAGKQVAVVVPTTVLAQQHFVTFRDRMAEYPVEIDTISRFRSRAEQNEILRRARTGELDILIGTHRLFSSDVSFADIGLVIIDEEQRFGVTHKERLKQLRRMVDVLTLTATPIPRTLHLALMGVRDISSLDEAPEGRRPIHTEVCVFDPTRFREIILRELNRDGQVFYVHNRVHSISAKRGELEQLVPEARMVEVHGQMDEHELERRMLDFIEKRIDVLVCTTIIESGLDIPSANTLIIERADRFGLSEMHQLRGRVGRGHHNAYAYFLLPEDRPVTGDALARLRAIEEYSQLGAGFQIAMRDLEIRGAGNILGKEQSGHITVVGYDLYCRLLQRAIDRLKGVPSREPPDVEIVDPEEAGIPGDYISDTRLRLRSYRAVATALDEQTLADIAAGMSDSYGPLPPETRRLFDRQQLRVALGRMGARKARLEDGWLMLSGDLGSVERQLRNRGWQTLRPPGDELAARPGDEPLPTMAAAHEALVATASPAS